MNRVEGFLPDDDEPDSEEAITLEVDAAVDGCTTAYFEQKVDQGEDSQLVYKGIVRGLIRALHGWLGNYEMVRTIGPDAVNAGAPCETPIADEVSRFVHTKCEELEMEDED